MGRNACALGVTAVAMSVENFTPGFAGILELHAVTEQVEFNGDDCDSVAHLVVTALMDWRFGITVPA